MRGRLATECHYSQEYIDALEMPAVTVMWEYWCMEPPASKLLALRYGYGVKEESSSTPPGVLNRGIPFHKLPVWLKNSIIKRSGLTEIEYYRRVNAAAREKYLGKKEAQP